VSSIRPKQQPAPGRPGSDRRDPDRLRRAFQGRRQRHQPRRRGRAPGFRPAARRLASADAATQGKAAAALIPPLVYDLDQLRRSFAPQMVTIKTLAAGPGQGLGIAGRPGPRPGDPEGRSQRHQRAAKLRDRGASCRAHGDGRRDSYYESGKAVTAAFIEAAFSRWSRSRSCFRRLAARDGRASPRWSRCYSPAPRHAGDLRARRLRPSISPNIIALPLLLGVGVAFKIYYIMAWRPGNRSAAIDIDQSGDLQRHDQCRRVRKHVGVKLSGMSSMGKMMALSLLCTLAAAVLFQPVLMDGAPGPKPVSGTPSHCPRLPNSFINAVRGAGSHRPSSQRGLPPCRMQARNSHGST